MHSNILYRVFLMIAIGSIALGLFFLYQGLYIRPASGLLIGGFALLAMALRGFRKFRGFSYTCWIFTAVACAMFYPEWFTGIGDFSFKKLIVPLLQIIMFGVGSTMGLKDFAGIVRTPHAVFVGIVCQFTIMPAVGFMLAHTFDFPSEIAAGVILIGCVPSGLASNVMSYIANANVALSVTLTALATLMAPVVTPFLMKLLAGQFVEIGFLSMMWDITQIVILPIAAGLLYNYFLGGKFKWLDRAMPVLSMVGIALIITVITAAGRDSLLAVGHLLVLASLIHNLTGYSLGYISCKFLKMDEKTCRTIALEVGLQNGGLASGLALQMGKVATVGLAPAVFGPLMNITGSSLAIWWHGRPPKE